MHELSIAMSILDMLDEESRKRGNVGITAVHLKIGPLSGVVRDALEGAYEMARQGTAFEDCNMVIKETPLVVFCPQCNGQRSAESVTQLCSECGTPCRQVVSGRELEVCALEVCS